MLKICSFTGARALGLACILTAVSGCGDNANTNRSLATNVTDEPAGANCAAGGSRHDVGVDDNGNGALEPGEIDFTFYSCATAKSSNKSTNEAAGANCPYGGTRHDVGVDRNGNGTLDDGEIDYTFYDCLPQDSLANVHIGDLVLQTPADVAAAQSVVGVFGNLIISVNSPMDVTLPKLQWVTGMVADWDIFSGPPLPLTLTSIHLPALAHVSTGVIFGSSTAATIIDLPELQGIEGGGNTPFGPGPPPFLWVNNLDALTTLNVPKLAVASGGIEVRDNDVLTTFSLPALKVVRIGGLVVGDNPMLDDCNFYSVLNRLLQQDNWNRDFDINGNIDCTDTAKTCISVPIGGDSTNWKECLRDVDWASAKAACEGQGAGWGLAYFTADSDLTAMDNSILADDEIEHWVGYTDAAMEGTWVWDHNANGNTYAPQGVGAPLWDANQPDNSGGTENCLAMWWQSGVSAGNDASCGELHRPLCRHAN